MPRAVVALVCLLVLGGAAAPAEEEIVGAFNGYRQALSVSDGGSAAPFISERTFQHYDEMVRLTLHGARADLENAAFIDRFMILRVRAHYDTADLQRMTGRDLFIQAVDNGWVGSNLAQVQLGRIDVLGTRARGQVVVNDQQANFGFNFFYEQDAWKLDVTPAPWMNASMLAVAERMGMSETDFIDHALKTLGYGRGLTPELWAPPAPD